MKDIVLRDVSAGTYTTECMRKKSCVQSGSACKVAKRCSADCWICLIWGGANQTGNQDSTQLVRKHAR